MISIIKSLLDRLWTTRVGALTKKYILKIILNNHEKYLFDLLAPESPLQSKAQNGYLYKWQWFKCNKVVFPLQSRDGNYLPWFTFPFIAWIDQRIKPGTPVLELGAGSSTLWLRSLECKVHTLEHDKYWTSKVSSYLESGIRIQTIPYWSEEAAEFPTGPFEIIVVDGRQRVKSIKRALPSLSSTGVIILDDSERNKYQPARQFLYDREFRALDFHGLRHQSTSSSCTSVFYRTKNCLNI